MEWPYSIIFSIYLGYYYLPRLLLFSIYLEAIIIFQFTYYYFSI